jgi:hypothetical protein
MRTIAVTSICAALASLLLVSAFAAPATPLHSSAPSGVILVAQGCPAGEHRGPQGHCRLNNAPGSACPAGYYYSSIRHRCWPRMP